MKQTHINADFTKTLGKIKPMNAVNNGPSSNPGTKSGNLEAYAALKIPYARNHDAAFWSVYGGEHTVDVHRIFRNFDADECDPASYDFEMTDRYVRVTEDAGTRTFYRLGAKIEHEKKEGTFPPKDFAKWARICEHIIRHYTQGWADGFTYDITYWEIWNEPDCVNPDGTNPCWQGTEEQFFDFYATAAKHLKDAFPHLKIGGPAFCSCDSSMMLPFLKEMKKRGVSMDFVSFHYYGYDVERMRAAIRTADALITEGGYPDAERILNEWNLNYGWVGEEKKRSMIARLSQRSAAFVGAVMAMGQEESVDMLMYYDMRPCTSFNGVFAPYTLDPLPTYHAFECFRDVAEAGTQVRTSGDAAGGVYTVGAADAQSGAVMISNLGDAKNVCLNVRLPGKCGARATVTVYAEGEENPAPAEIELCPTEGGVCVPMPKDALALVKFGFHNQV